jgi:uroporphyrinogen decarboxylase
MTSRERVQRTLRFQHPDRAPRELWALPAIHWFRQDEWEEVTARFPFDFTGPRFRYGESRRARGEPSRPGFSVDEWGSGWEVLEAGRIGEVKQPALPDWSALDRYQLPWELLLEADFSEVNQSCAETDLFVRAGTLVRPFERMQFLRGSENLFLDLAYGVPEVYRLRDQLHEFFLAELRLWAKTDVDAISFMDDWGAQAALLVSPDLWRSFYQPLYRDYCDLIHAAGKFVFFHSDGHIAAIYPDLIEIGVDALNSQLFCMDIEGLAAQHKGKVTFWGELDRQWLLPCGTPDEVRAAVRRVRAALDDGCGGVIAQCEWGLKDPVENILAALDEWQQPRERLLHHRDTEIAEN